MYMPVVFLRGGEFDLCHMMLTLANLWHICSEPAQFECICNAGFYGDGYLCIEEQNCQNTPTLCDPNANCQSTNNGIACVCNPGK